MSIKIFGNYVANLQFLGDKPKIITTTEKHHAKVFSENEIAMLMPTLTDLGLSPTLGYAQ